MPTPRPLLHGASKHNVSCQFARRCPWRGALWNTIARLQSNRDRHDHTFRKLCDGVAPQHANTCASAGLQKKGFLHNWLANMFKVDSLLDNALCFCSNELIMRSFFSILSDTSRSCARVRNNFTILPCSVHVRGCKAYHSHADVHELQKIISSTVLISNNVYDWVGPASARNSTTCTSGSSSRINVSRFIHIHDQFFRRVQEWGV